MEKSEISIQLYTARKFEPYEPILNFFSESGIINIELFGLESIDIDEFKTIMGSSNISSRSTHVGFEALKDTQNIIDRAKKLEIKHVIVPAPPARKDAEFKDTFEMDQDEWTTFGKDLSAYVNEFEDAGLTLGYHNHSYEFKPLPSGKLPIECMMEHNDNLKLEIDLGWAIAGGADPLPWIEKYSNKIIACHLKDFYSKDKDMLDHDNQSAVGDGFIDWNTLILALKKIGCKLFILEHDDPKDYKDYTQRSLKNLMSL
jgi:sugar phosphate isomerase/epimerase